MADCLSLGLHALICMLQLRSSSKLSLSTVCCHSSVQQLCCKLHKLHLHQALRLQCSVQPLGVAQGSCTAKFGVAVHQHTDEWCSCRLVWQTSRGGGSTWVPNGVEMAQTLSVHWSTATRLCATSSLGKMTVCARPARYPSCVCHTPT